MADQPMTPERIEAFVIRAILNVRFLDAPNVRLARDQIAAAIREAVAAETERCAKIGEDIKADWQCYAGACPAVQAVIDGIRTASKDSNSEAAR